MSFAAPFALCLLIPFAALIWVSRRFGPGPGTSLPGAWARVVGPRFRRTVAARSDIAAAKAPWRAVGIGTLVIAALARPGLDVRQAEDFATVAGRVVVLDVGADLARHRQFLNGLIRTDPDTVLAVVAVSGDAYRITPFTTDGAHTDRYARVLEQDMMPRPGLKPHIGLARAERILEDGGFLVRQIVFLSARRPPDSVVPVPDTGADRIVVGLDPAQNWEEWAQAQNARHLGPGDYGDIAADLSAAARAAARSELPAARFEITPGLVLLAAFLWLPTFRRREA